MIGKKQKPRLFKTRVIFWHKKTPVLCIAGVNFIFIINEYYLYSCPAVSLVTFLRDCLEVTGERAQFAMPAVILQDGLAERRYVAIICIIVSLKNIQLKILIHY